MVPFSLERTIMQNKITGLSVMGVVLVISLMGYIRDVPPLAIIATVSINMAIAAIAGLVADAIMTVRQDAIASVRLRKPMLARVRKL
jgi:hypothetical protein